jgi:hypothetical protein
LAPEGPKPGKLITNFRMFVGLWAKGYALRIAHGKLTAALAAAPVFKSCRLVSMGRLPILS